MLYSLSHIYIYGIAREMMKFFILTWGKDDILFRHTLSQTVFKSHIYSVLAFNRVRRMHRSHINQYNIY